MTSSSSTASTSDLGTSAVPASLRCLTTARDATNGAHALGIALGCRVLRAHDVRGARRTATVVAAILEARR